MMNKKTLIITVSIFTLTGVSISLWPLLASLQPNAKGDAALPRFKVSLLEKGEFRIARHPIYGDLYNGFIHSIFLYRKHNGDFVAYNIPTKYGKVGLPDNAWWRPGYECIDFGPTIIDKKVDESLPIKCHDKFQISESWLEQWEWTIDGKSLEPGIVDMQPTHGVIEGEHFVLGKSS